MSRSRKAVLVSYLAMIHLLLGAALLRSDFLPRVGARLGWTRHVTPSPFYSETVAHQLRMDANVPDGSILFFGDSITQQLCASAVTAKAVNFGIGGDTIEQLARRIVRYRSVARAQALILAIGLRDAAAGRTDLARDYGAMVRGLPQSVPLLVSGVLPVDERNRPRAINSRIAALNGDLRKLCRGVAQCRYIEVPSGFLDDTGNLDPRYHVGDGRHLSPEGYRVWAAGLRSAISSLGSGR